MITRLLLLALTLIPSGDRSIAEAPRLGHLAPDMQVTKWLTRPPRIPVDPSLAFFSGKVILVHSFELDQDPAVGKLLGEVAEACADRDLRMISLVRAGKVPGYKLAEHGIEHSAGEVGDEGSPYVREGEGGAVVLIGRAREVRWMGQPAEDETAFLEALDEALRLPRGPRLDQDPLPELRAVAEELWEARWDKARKLAKKVLGDHDKGRDEEDQLIARNASAILMAIDRHEEDLLGEATGAVRSDAPVAYWNARLAIEHGFPRSKTARSAKALEKEAMRSQKVLMFSDAEKYLLKIHPDRPILFPVRKSKEGDAYAKSLEKFMKASDNLAGVTLRAAELVERYGRN